jgi:hypothetical protein
MAEYTEQYPDLKNRPVKETICLFDVDGTLTPARKRVSPEMFKLLSELRHKCAIGFVRHNHVLFKKPFSCPQTKGPIQTNSNLYLMFHIWRAFISLVSGRGLSSLPSFCAYLSWLVLAGTN